MAGFAFWCSSNTALQTSTHSLQMYTRPEPSAGFAISVSTWSWALLQNEHLRISSWRLKSIVQVWRERSASQDWLMSKSAAANRGKPKGFSKDQKILRLPAKRLLAPPGSQAHTYYPDSMVPIRPAPFSRLGVFLPVSSQRVTQRKWFWIIPRSLFG